MAALFPAAPPAMRRHAAVPAARTSFVAVSGAAQAEPALGGSRRQRGSDARLREEALRSARRAAPTLFAGIALALLLDQLLLEAPGWRAAWLALTLIFCCAWALAQWLRAARIALAREERLRVAEAERDAALRADEEKSRFLAIASHDLRQPMHALGLFAGTLERRLQGSAEEPLLHNLVRAIDGLDRSFNVMLDISRLDAGTIEPNLQQFPLRDVFRRLHMHFAGQAEQAGLALRFAPGGKSVTSDPQLLERLLGNLVQNAIKYTERGGIAVIARTTRDYVNVEVWDTGVGIEASELPRIFHEFYQVGGGGRARERGFGMGLAIVKRLAQLLGLRLVVASRPGRGTVFRVGIPVGGLPELQDLTAAADTLPMPLPASQPRTVLIVEDEAAIREGLGLLLEEWGYQAVAARTAEDAERLARRLDVPPDLILSDLHLGNGPDGLAAIEAVRRGRGHEVAAMLITGDTSPAELRRANESGHPVLFKPVQARKLLNALRGHIP
ncbi:MAG TPA: hybrid sensor histidine kinase/response regulator [Ramlibacter sp.]|uniref:ATP-binding response regulator n=1 Tax=Ramlibacter sp. TaxID=1917967 RepID=UPI002D7EDF1D|nr:hybrid sensor histidine kinase/response regulator [Ramlibacter sp.]HET8746247.1 hybrid sensor histidine kinase/response regulator [Ramlibacter sp.]